MKNVLFHSLPGTKAAELCKLLAEKAQNCFVTAENICQNNTNPCKVSVNIAEEEIDSLVIAFPDGLHTNDPDLIAEKVLTESFKLIKNFVQIRMKKKFGQILCLIDARANGMPYTSNSNNASESENLSPNPIFLASQGGLIGLSKTIAKEYSKRGIINNVLYIDWHAVPLNEVAARVDSLFVESLFNNNTNLNGQVIALDGGKWL